MKEHKVTSNEPNFFLKPGQQVTSLEIYGQADRFNVKPLEDGIGLFLQNQRLTLLVGDGHSSLEHSLPEALYPGRWYEVAVAHDLASGLGAVFLRPSTSSAHEEPRGSRTLTGHRRLEQLPAVPIMLGTSAKYVSGWTAAEESFKGTIESPYVCARSTPATALRGMHARRLDVTDLVAAWDFSVCLSSDGLRLDQVPDVVGSFHADCVKCPIRGGIRSLCRLARNGTGRPSAAITAMSH